MQASTSFKQSLLKNMLVGLQVESSMATSNNTSLLERKRAIKLTSNIATAFARGRGANWSRAVMADIAREDKNTNLVRRILGRDSQGLAPRLHDMTTSKVVKSKRILKRSLYARRPVRKCARSLSSCQRATGIARRMVLKRTRVLKSLIPGGRYVNDYPSLLGETLDYVVSLKAQVDLMQHLAKAIEVFNGSHCPMGSGDVLQEKKWIREGAQLRRSFEEKSVQEK